MGSPTIISGAGVWHDYAPKVGARWGDFTVYAWWVEKLERLKGQDFGRPKRELETICFHRESCPKVCYCY